MTVIIAWGLFIAILTSTKAIPVSQGESHPPSSSSVRHSNHLASQDLHVDPHLHQAEHHELSANVNYWVDSIYSEGHTSPTQAAASPPLPKGNNDFTMQKRPANEQLPFKSNADYLNWVDSVLNDDQYSNNHALPMTSTPSTHDALFSEHVQPSSSSSSIPSQPCSIRASDHDSRLFLSGTNTKGNNANHAPRKMPYKTKWSKGRSVKAIDNIRNSLDQLAIIKFGSTNNHRRIQISSTLNKGQLDHLGQGLSPFSMPGLASHQDSSKGNDKSQFSLDRVRRRRPWKEGLSDTDVQKILKFSDILMEQRGASSLTSRNELLRSLSNEEQQAIAREDEEGKERILARLAPKKTNFGAKRYKKNIKGTSGSHT